MKIQACRKATYPVAISNSTQPMDQISGDPSLPLFSLLITSGAMYIGVPAKDIMFPGSPAPPAGALDCLMARVRAMVLLPLAMTLAAPKSTNFSCDPADKRISDLLAL